MWTSLATTVTDVRATLPTARRKPRCAPDADADGDVGVLGVVGVAAREVEDAEAPVPELEQVLGDPGGGPRVVDADERYVGNRGCPTVTRQPALQHRLHGLVVPEHGADDERVDEGAADDVADVVGLEGTSRSDCPAAPSSAASPRSSETSPGSVKA